MKKEKIAKIAIFTTAIAIAASGITYTILKKEQRDYSNYISSVDNIVSDDYLIAAHRGFSSLEIENSREAIQLASEKPYIDFIEIDVRMTKDHKFVLSHDDKIISSSNSVVISFSNYDEVTNKIFWNSGTVARWNLFGTQENQLKRERSNGLYNKAYYIVGLSKGLEYCGDKIVLLDVKFGNEIITLCDALIEELKDIDQEKIIIQSSNYEGLKYIKEHTNFVCQLLVSDKSFFKYIDEFDYIGLNYKLLDKELYELLKSKGKKISLWTIDSISELDNILEIVGEDYNDIIFITNYPDLIENRLVEIDDSKVLRKEIV